MLNNPSYLVKSRISDFIAKALEEDVGSGDHSSLASINPTATGKAELIIKEQGILAGVDAALEVFSQVDPNLKISLEVIDGESISPGDLVMTIEGKARSILSAERLALNIIQRMSGIATKTANLTELIAHTECQLLDTRKTTPNFRIFEKWAVLLGGGHNHRFALYDMIMLKDNHIDYAGGVEAAVNRTKDYLARNNLDLRIEVETRTLDEVSQAANLGVDVILLDNMSAEMMREAVAIIAGKAKTEASGGITESTIAEYAETGVDFISVGALTHSYKSLDMSLIANIN